MPMSPDVSVIVVSYNARSLLPGCIGSIVGRDDDGLDVEIVVVDNDSSDGTAAFVRDRYPEVRVVEAGRNGGMAAGSNVGMRHATGRLFLLLNSDAELRDGALRTMVDILDANPGVGMVGPRLLNDDGSLQRSARSFPTVWRLATEFWMLRKLAPRSRALNAFYCGGFDHATERDVDWLTGACMLVRRSDVERIGLMDESYFMFSEEVDWAWRMREAGLAVRFVPAAEVVHLGGGSTRTMWERMYRVQVTNHVRFLARHRGSRTARRARTMLRAALAARAVGFRLAALAVRGGRGTELRERARLAASARAALGVCDLETLAVASIPPFDPVEQVVPPAR